jgi:hypothetical protein
MEDFYYHAIYDVLRDRSNEETTIIAMRRLKAKIVNLHAVNKKRLLLDAGEQDITMGMEPTIYHLIKRWKRQTSRMVTRILDTEDTVQTSAKGILQTFAKYMRKKFDTPAVNENQMRNILIHMKTRLSPEANMELEAPITMEEM